MRCRAAPTLLTTLTLAILAACGGEPAPAPTPVPATPVPTTQVPPTAEPSATPIPEPTATLAPTKTPLPEGVLFRDDFDGAIDPGWEWENENPDRWALTEDGWLQIVGSPSSLLGDGSQENLLWHDLPTGDFVINAHLKALPFENFHQATIYIYEDPDNYIALNRGYCDICPTGGGGFYMEYKVTGNFGAYNVATEADDVYLRLESGNQMISGYYAFEPDGWQRLGRFGNFFDFTRVGIGVSNVGATEDVVGQFDYFEIALP